MDQGNYCKGALLTGRSFFYGNIQFYLRNPSMVFLPPKRDNAIVNYVNATFYPKMVADVTTGTTTTAQMLYNPLPVENCCC